MKRNVGWQTLFLGKGGNPPLSSLLWQWRSFPARSFDASQAFDQPPEIEALVVHKVPPASQTSANRRSSCNGEKTGSPAGPGERGELSSSRQGLVRRSGSRLSSQQQVAAESEFTARRLAGNDAIWFTEING